MRTSNPALGANTFNDFRTTVVADESAMTLQGTVNKTGLLLLLLMASAAWVWNLFYQPGSNPQSIMPWMIGGLVGGIIFMLITTFKKTAAPITAPLYAICEGLVLGGISAMFEFRFPNIVIQAVGLTFGTLFMLLLAYRSGLIKATENFKMGIFAATGGIAFVYIVSMVLNLFGIRMPYIHDAGLIGIGFSLFVVVIAALNLVLDFDFIEKGVEAGAPKYMEWYAGFGLLVTLVWLYLEVLKLLAKLQQRDR